MTEEFIMESLSVAEADRTVIPESCLSFSEMADYLTEFTNSEFYNLMESIGIDELSIFENTGVMAVYEAEKAEQLSVRFITHFNNIWKAYKNFWEKALVASVESEKRAKAMLKGISKASTKNLVKDKTYGSTHKFTASHVDYASNGIKFSKQTEKAFRTIAKSADTKGIKEAKSILEESICKMISGVDCNSNNSMKKAVKSNLVGESIKADGAWISANYSTLEKYVLKGATTEVIKKAYNEEKKLFAELSKQFNKMDDTVSKVAGAWASICNLTLNLSHTCYAIELDVLTRRTKEYTILLSKALKAKPVTEATEAPEEDKKDDAESKASEKEEKDTVQESYVKQYDMIKESFNF